jgi:hypothetical protein
MMSCKPWVASRRFLKYCVTCLGIFLKLQVFEAVLHLDLKKRKEEQPQISLHTNPYSPKTILSAKKPEFAAEKSSLGLDINIILLLLWFGTKPFKSRDFLQSKRC